MNRESGVALITAVMVVAFASTAAATLMVKQNLAVHRSANLLAQDQAWWYLIGLEEWAATLLDRDREDNEIDHLGEPWAQPVDFLPVDQGALSGSLEDLQGRFNLRGLIQGAAQEEEKARFVRLLRGIEEWRSAPVEDLATRIIDWMDADTQPGFPGGAEDSVYLSREIPHRTPNREIASLSELLLIDGMERELYASLLPHVTFLPADTRINVNTATAPVLLSIHEEMTPAQVDAIITQRLDTPYESAQDFVADEILQMTLQPEAFAVQSEYFLARGAASVGNVRIGFVSLLERKGGGRTQVLAHSRNAL